MARSARVLPFPSASPVRAPRLAAPNEVVEDRGARTRVVRAWCVPCNLPFGQLRPRHPADNDAGDERFGACFACGRRVRLCRVPGCALPLTHAGNHLDPSSRASGWVAPSPRPATAFFFGVWPGTAFGHLLATETGRVVTLPEARAVRLPWAPSRLHRLAPSSAATLGAGREPEGAAALYAEGGWTALGFWDRTGDERAGSCTVLVLAGTYAFCEVLGHGREVFPALFARLDRAGVRLVPVPPSG
jgi:hypothetical protein